MKTRIYCRSIIKSTFFFLLLVSIASKLSASTCKEHSEFEIIQSKISIFTFDDILMEQFIDKNDFVIKDNKLIIPSYSKRKNDSRYLHYISLNGHFIDLKGVGLTYGFYPARYFSESIDFISINFSYHFAQQAYKSIYMKTPKEEVNIRFHGFGIGIAGDISGSVSSSIKFLFTPEFVIGIEQPQIKPLLFDNKIDGLRTWYYKPGVKTSLMYGQYGLGLGLSYYFYEAYVRDLNKSILIDNITSKTISYSKDMFPGREGLQLSFSLIFNF